MRREVDWGLYLVTDRGLSHPRSLLEVVREAVAGGVSAVQLREKDSSSREFLSLARELLVFLRPRGIPLIINDRVDIALASGADGVHLGQTDLPCSAARGLLGPGAIIGLSLETWGDLKEAQDLEVDYLAVSPVFPTPTKTDTGLAWGLAGLAALREETPKPLIGIGGINPLNAAGVIAAGADGIAVVSAICAAPSPRREAERLRELVMRAKAGQARPERGGSRG